MLTTHAKTCIFQNIMLCITNKCISYMLIYKSEMIKIKLLTNLQLFLLDKSKYVR